MKKHNKLPIVIIEMPLDEEESCKDCRFWKAMNVVPGISNEHIVIHGQCHRFPPVKNGSHAEYPITDDNEWCGEWDWTYSDGSAPFHDNNETYTKIAEGLASSLTSDKHV